MKTTVAMTFRTSLPALLITVLILSPVQAVAQDLQTLLNLRGSWKFEIGDDMNRALPDFNDRTWVTVEVPSPWEDEGFPGYDGYAWYRKHFSAKPEWKEKVLYLRLGVIDDVDEVYVNGHFLGFSGQFPPRYITAYSVYRQYHLPADYLDPSGNNTIAVRVFDDELSGGITGGEIAIVEMTDALVPDLALRGDWKFKTGDEARYREPGFNDATWETIRVPAYWETGGHKGYDGYGWYRLRFRVPASLAQERLVLLLGKVDDIDETFVNGQRIGRTGPASAFGEFGFLSDDYLKLRAYTLPPELLLLDRENVIAVRVFDGFMHGGLYDGPVGLVTRDNFVRWERRQEKGGKWFQRFIDLFSH